VQNKLFLFLLFGVMVLLQWFVPSKMIWNQEDILTNGELYKFECKPIDPYDPFRGKYITLENVVIAEASSTIDIKGTQDVAQYINFPFNRYYMEESKAKPAEDFIRESARDSLLSTYAIVMIKDGNAVLKDVMVDGVPIRELVKNQN